MSEPTPTLRNKGIDPEIPPVNGAPKVGIDAWGGLIRDGADLAIEVLLPLIEVIAGIIAFGSKLIIGSGSKSYKTWLTMYATLCVAHGLDCMGRKTTRHKVLYCNLELKETTFTRRVQALASAMGITIDREWFYHLPLRGQLCGLPTAVIVNRIIHEAKKKACGVVVLDPYYKLLQGEENSSHEQTMLLNELDRICTEANCTLIMNDHFGKGFQNEKDPLDTLRGSSAKGGDCDAAMILRKHVADDCYSVDIIHRELPPVEPFVIGWKYPLFELRPELLAAEMKAPGQGKKYDVVKLLEFVQSTTKDNPISVTAWALKVPMERTTLTGYLPTMRTKNWIATVGEGTKARTYITDKGLAELAA